MTTEIRGVDKFTREEIEAIYEERKRKNTTTCSNLDDFIDRHFLTSTNRATGEWHFVRRMDFL